MYTIDLLGGLPWLRAAAVDRKAASRADVAWQGWPKLHGHLEAFTPCWSGLVVV